MKTALSPDTQAILLLTAPLISGRRRDSDDILRPSEYSRLAEHLRELNQTPSGFLTSDGSPLVYECRHIIEEDRLRKLLDRGFLLSQAVELWQSRAIWVISRADPHYPRRLKARLREASPALLYGCGDCSGLDGGGLAVVGSRDVSQELEEYTRAIGALAARAGKAIVSGGAKGIDQAAMGGALDAGGRAVGILADSLAKRSIVREHRSRIVEGCLLLVSPFDPSAGFNVGNAMQRNKVIYALADAGLVVSSDLNKGGTWAGATEQLRRFRSVPVYVRVSGEASEGLSALQQRGAKPWPEPASREKLGAILDGLLESEKESGEAVQMELLSVGFQAPDPSQKEDVGRVESSMSPAAPAQVVDSEEVHAGDAVGPSAGRANEVWLVLEPLLVKPLSEIEIAEALSVTKVEARRWMMGFVEEGRVQRRERPVRYVIGEQSARLPFENMKKRPGNADTPVKDL